MVGEATEHVGDAAESLEPEAYEEGDIEDEGEPGEPGLRGPEELTDLIFSCLGLRCFVVLEDAVVPTLDDGDCGELGPEIVSVPDKADTEEGDEELVVLVPFAAAAAASSSSSGISLA